MKRSLFLALSVSVLMSSGSAYAWMSGFQVGELIEKLQQLPKQQQPAPAQPKQQPQESRKQK